VSEADRSAAPIGGVVLLYHRVTHLRSDPQLLAVMPARFSEHLRVIQRLGHPMALRAMAAAATMDMPTTCSKRRRC
jgi:hypothetical protein